MNKAFANLTGNQECNEKQKEEVAIKSVEKVSKRISPTDLGCGVPWHPTSG